MYCASACWRGAVYPFRWNDRLQWMMLNCINRRLALQAERRRAVVEGLTLRRTRQEVGTPPPPPLLELTLPVDMAPSQATLYRTVLSRHFELLADPKPPHHAGHRCPPPARAFTPVPQTHTAFTAILCHLRMQNWPW